MNKDNLSKHDLEIIKGFEEVMKNRLPDEYQFPYINDKFYESYDSDGSEPDLTPTAWLMPYWQHRSDCEYLNQNNDEQSYRTYLEENGIDNSIFKARCRGAFLGLAIGDALGTTNEFKQPGTFEPITDIVGGGPFQLQEGDWTDDTSMALCLALSLLRSPGFNAEDQMEAYTMWWKRGAFSATGKCFDIGNTVKAALTSYTETKNPYSGLTDARSAGNGSLMRLIPIVLYYYDDPEKMLFFAGESSKTTHRTVEAIDACRYFAALVHGALSGVKREQLLNGLYTPVSGYWDKNPLCEGVKKIANGSYKNKSKNDLNPSAYVINTLECVLWAFSNSTSFQQGALEAVNLGGDADTIGAIYGQIAGAYYNEFNFPIEWIRKTAWAHFFYLRADELIKKSFIDTIHDI